MEDREVGSAAWIADRVELLAGRRLPARPVVIDDTTNFMAIDRDHVIAVGGTYFLVNGTGRERRFGLVDEPKFWVKRATDLSTGKACILKLVFDEEFRVTVGASEIHCRRNAEKEACVLELVRGDSRFMQGRSARDCRGNVLHFVAGRGFVTFRGVLERRADLAGRLTDEDASVFFPHRVMNLRKVFPHLPERLNEILLRFSVGVPRRYSAVAEVVADLVELAGSSGWPLPALA